MSVVVLALLLAFVQGATEFLPISSSGHLALAEAWGGIVLPADQMLFFNVFLHLGTLLPVLWYYRHELLTLLRSILRPLGEARAAWRYLGLLALAELPTGVIGLAFHDFFEERFHNPKAVGVELLISAALLLGTLALARRSQDDAVPQPGSAMHASHLGVGLSAWAAFAIGCAQALAIAPGISRSGATVAAALLLGVPRIEAARFSFLISIPAILGAALLEALKLTGTAPPAMVLIPSFVVSALVGYASLVFLVRVIQRGRFWMFAPYLIVLGVAAIVWG